MKEYEFNNRESCLKFLTYLNVNVDVPDKDTIFPSSKASKVIYTLSVSQRVCYKGTLSIVSPRIKRIKTHVFYDKELHQESDDPHPFNELQNDTPEDKLKETIQRLRRAYHQTK